MLYLAAKPLYLWHRPNGAPIHLHDAAFCDTRHFVRDTNENSALPWFSEGFPLYLAPMAGVSDKIFRQLCKEYGADILTTNSFRPREFFAVTNAPANISTSTS